MAGSNPQALVDWFNKWENDLDFDGDAPEALGKALRKILDDHGTYNQSTIGDWINFYVEGQRGMTAAEFSTQLGFTAKAQVEERIKEAKTAAQLEEVDYDKLQPETKRLWSNQENKIVFRERAYELSAEDIQTLHGRRGVKFFADFYNLDMDEARDVLRQRGVLSDRDTIKQLGEE